MKKHVYQPGEVETKPFTPQDFQDTASEASVARSVATWAHLNLRNVVFWHTPNEGKRSKWTAGDLKAQGMISGVADFVFLWDGRCGCIELKSPKAYKMKNHNLSDAQMDFADWCKGSNVPFAVCCSLEQVQDTLKQWGAL